MRKIGQFEDKDNAEKFCYLLAYYGITAKYQEDDLIIWVLDDENLVTAKEHFENFQENPHDASLDALQQKGKKILVEKTVEEEKKERQKSRQIDVRSEVFHSTSLQMNITNTMIFFAVFLYLIDIAGYAIPLRKLFLISLYLGYPKEIIAGQIWRAITPIFLHQGIFHILFNMYWLYKIGSSIEQKSSRLTYVFVLLFTATIPNFTHYYLLGPQFVGMSGVIYGLFGYIWAQDRYRINSPYRIDTGIIQFFIVWYILCWLISVIGMPIANTIHGTGAFVGIICGYCHSLWIDKGHGRIPQENLHTILLFLALLGGGIYTDLLLHAR